MRSIILLLVCLFSICLKAQTEFRVYQKESKKSWYYISAPINGTKLNDILITTGDAGFYSLLSYIKENLDEKIEVITGISSVQYMFSKMGDVWNDVFISSVHGRELNLASIINEYNKIGLLTDSKYTPQRIAEIIFQSSCENIEITVGENLSYENESIRTYEIEELIKEKKKFGINVVVIRKIGN